MNRSCYVNQVGAIMVVRQVIVKFDIVFQNILRAQRFPAVISYGFIWLRSLIFHTSKPV